MGRCEDFPCCGHQAGECPTGESKQCPECGRTFVPCSDGEEYCLPCGQTPRFNSREDYEDWLDSQDDR